MKKPFLYKAFFLLPLLLVSASSFAQQATPADAGAPSFFYDKLFSTIVLVVAGLIILAAVAAMYRLLDAMIKVQQIQVYREKGLESFLEEVQKEKESWWTRLMRSWTKAVPVEREQDVLFDHDYDGIRELDNSLPPWWVALFYITIAFAAVYMSYYHFFGKGLGSQAEYEQEMQRAEEAVAAFRAQQADQVTEDRVSHSIGRPVHLLVVARRARLRTKCEAEQRLVVGTRGRRYCREHVINVARAFADVHVFKIGAHQMGPITWAVTRRITHKHAGRMR